MRHLLLGLVAVASLTLAQRAAALALVDYPLDGVNSKLTITSPFSAVIPPSGTLDGLIRVAYTSDSSGNIIDGPATLQMFEVSSDLNIATSVPVLGSFTLTGPVAANLKSPVVGALAGNTLSFGGATGNFHAEGTVTCTGAPCSVASLPNGQPFPFQGDRLVPVPTLTLGSIHGSLTGLTFAGVSATLTFDAEGFSVPEPSLSLLGALAVAFVALRRPRA